MYCRVAFWRKSLYGVAAVSYWVAILASSASSLSFARCADDDPPPHPVSRIASTSTTTARLMRRS